MSAFFVYNIYMNKKQILITTIFLIISILIIGVATSIWLINKKPNCEHNSEARNYEGVGWACYAKGSI